jgi:hypothetical protein
MIYRFLPDSNNWACLETTVEVRDQLDVVLSNASTIDWQTPALGIDNTMGKLPDFPSLIQPLPVVSKRANDLIHRKCGHGIHEFPISLHGTDLIYYVLRVPVVDCLDADRSELLRSQINGRITQVRKYVFRSLPNDKVGLFKIPQSSGRETLCTELFKKVVTESQLTGLVFRAVKSNE